MDSWDEPVDSWGATDAWGNTDNTQDAWGDDDGEKKKKDRFVPAKPNQLNQDLAQLTLEEEDDNVVTENKHKDENNDNNNNKKKNEDNNNNEEKGNGNDKNDEKNKKDKSGNENENEENNEKGKKRRKKKNKSKKGEKRRCNGCKEHFLKEDMTMHEKTQTWYCSQCKQKEKCMDCKKYVSPDFGKADEYGGWYCTNCWTKFTAQQEATFKAEDPNQFMSGKMKNYEKQLHKQW